MDEQARERKGRFAAAKLPVALRYVFPHSRRGVVIWGGVAGLALALYSALDFELGRATFVSSGPLSSAHAHVERDRDCGACHLGMSGVADERCQECHERSGDAVGVFSYASHVVYRSGDPARAAEPRVSEHPKYECSACHVEHRGRAAAITEVRSEHCADCHGFDRFEAHPEFEFARLGARQAPGLHSFTHLGHVRKVSKKYNFRDVERACLACHEPTSGGRRFAPLSYERHCGACHLKPDEKIEAPVRSAETNGIGVETFASVAHRRPAGSAWVDRVNPNEFETDDGLVIKQPVYHADPWVLHNLRELRALLQEPNREPGLAELLDVAVDARTDGGALQSRAIAALRQQNDGLRAVTDRGIQRDLGKIEAALERLERGRGGEAKPLSAADFAAAVLAADANPQRSDAVRDVANKVGKPCFECHNTRSVSIEPVQSDLRTLRRADFDHRAHVLQRRCLDCHHRIPIPEHAAADEKVDEGLDHPEILNLPDVATCQRCHNAEVASDACITCHAYHPQKDRLAGLLLSVEDSPEAQP